MTVLEIKQAVRERDGYRCTLCGMTEAEHRERFGRRLAVHRKEPGSVYSVDGCATVCNDCHGRLHQADNSPRVLGRRYASEGRPKRRPRHSPGTVQLGIEIPEELDARLRAFCRERKQKVSDAVRLALRRHVDYPPPDESPPLPDASPRPA